MRAYVLGDFTSGDPRSIVTAEECLLRLRRELAAGAVDLVVLNGDVWATYSRPLPNTLELSESLFEMLASISPRPGIVFLPSNHDFAIADRVQDPLVQRFLQRRRVAVWQQAWYPLGRGVYIAHGHQYEAYLHDAEPTIEWRRHYRQLNAERARRLEAGEGFEDLRGQIRVAERWRGVSNTEDWILEHLGRICGMDRLAADATIVFGHTHRRVAGRRFAGRLFYKQPSTGGSAAAF